MSTLDRLLLYCADQRINAYRKGHKFRDRALRFLLTLLLRLNTLI